MGRNLLDAQMPSITLILQERVVIELQIDDAPHESRRERDDARGDDPSSGEQWSGEHVTTHRSIP